MENTTLFLLLSILSGILAFHAEFTNEYIWRIILVGTQYFSLGCTLVLSGVIKLKKQQGYK